MFGEPSWVAPSQFIKLICHLDSGLQRQYIQSNCMFSTPCPKPAFLSTRTDSTPVAQVGLRPIMELSPPALTVQDEVRSEASKLVSMLDRYLFLCGDTITSYHDVSATLAKAAADSAETLRDDIPLSLQLFPPIDLSTHLTDLEREKAELKSLITRIATVCLNPSVVKFARQQLIAAYAAIRPHGDAQSLRPKGIAEILAILRAEETRANEPVEETFVIAAVTGVLSDGKVMSVLTCVMGHEYFATKSSANSAFHCSGATCPNKLPGKKYSTLCPS